LERGKAEPAQRRVEKEVVSSAEADQQTVLS
jgi:hypothetical protein